MQNNEQRIAARLLAFNSQVDARELFPTLVPEAADLVPGNPYAFCLATCLDRGTRADVIWTIPYWIKELLGHLDPHRIHQMPMEALVDLVGRLPKKPRYVDAAPRTIQDITRIVVEQFGGDAANIWKARRADDVREVFLSVYGVGRGIANMAVLLIEKGYGIRFSDLDRSRMDIKPDVHTRRVLFRLGVASTVREDAAIEAARRLNPSYPGELDGPLWLIGRRWCTSGAPMCGHCPLEEVCPKVEGVA
ncbi:MAG: hypothetical protein H8D78_16070 [Chloroflexi bacterium]|nr:hypothetical protein [Chloroflexota bacterium]